MDYLDSWYVSQIRQIIKDCEEVQQSSESDFTKKSEKTNAYEAIKEVLRVHREEDANEVCM